MYKSGPHVMKPYRFILSYKTNRDTTLISCYGAVIDGQNKHNIVVF